MSPHCYHNVGDLILKLFFENKKSFMEMQGFPFMVALIVYVQYILNE